LQSHNVKERVPLLGAALSRKFTEGKRQSAHCTPPSAWLRCRRRGRGSLERGDERGVLTLLRELKPRVVVALLEVLLPVAVERVDDALRVGVARVDDVARLPLRLVGGGGEALRDCLSEVALSVLQGVGLLAVGELVLVAHLQD